MWHSHLNDMKIPETKRFIPKGFELGTTLSEGVFTWENAHRREFHTGMTFDFVSRFHDDWVISHLFI